MLSRIVTPVLDVIDIDGIVQRIDINELLDRIDWNKVIDSIDVDRAIDRIDIQRIMDRVDVNDIVERAEIGAIVARSTSGVFSPMIDAIRSQFVIVDQAVQGVGCCRKPCVPEAPGLISENRPSLPKGSGNIAVAVQERYSGTFTRALAFLLDQLIVGMLYGLVFFFIRQAAEIVPRTPVGAIDESVPWISWSILGLWQFIYFVSALGATSRTPGKLIFGLKVINFEDGSPVKIRRAVVRTLLLPLSLFLLIGVAIGIIRRDRRELHDIIAKTGVVYSWDARMARYRQEQLERSESLYDGQDLNGTMNTYPSAQGLRQRPKAKAELTSYVEGSARSHRQRSSESIHL